MTPAGLEPPKWATDLCAHYGRNPLGENQFRVVFSPRRLQTYGGYWNDSGVFEYRMVRRYAPTCWVLERWLSPKHYGNAVTWAQETSNGEGYLSIGPFPKWGVFEACTMFYAADHTYIPLMPDIVSMTLRSIWVGRIRTTSDIRQQIMSEEEFKTKRADKEFEQAWDQSHGVRRGMSFSSDGVIQNNLSEVEQYKVKLATTDIKVKKDEFRPGFQQFEEFHNGRKD